MPASAKAKGRRLSRNGSPASARSSSAFRQREGRRIVPAQMPVAPVIEFRKVSFAYLPRGKVLRELSFTVLPGEKVALIGPSGAGKSTLVKLITAECGPQSGEVFLSGCAVGD